MPSLSELQELVDSPNETLRTEYKEWLDLVDSTEARADLARHIAALANHGGGSIVFGITDAMQPAGANPFPKVTIDRDLIASIVKKYLEPPFQCEVQVIRSAGGAHPIVIVPPHGASPICAKAGGPEVNGKPKGIVQGAYYVRKPGPESEAVRSSAEWAPIIRRCVTHERAAILAAIDVAIRGPGPGLANIGDALKAWHDAARAVSLQDVAARPQAGNLKKWHWQLSYAIDRADAQHLPHGSMLDVLHQVNAETRDLVRSGWSMFYPFDRREMAPSFQTDAASGMGDADFLECSLLRAGAIFPDMWRVSTDGKATEIRNYWEDDPDMNVRPGFQPGTWFSPNMLVQALAEIVRHARSLSERFDEPTAVTFRIEWHGLQGRIIRDPLERWHNQWTARADRRAASNSWPVTMLKDAWPEIVADLAAPALRLFTAEHLWTAEWVQGQSPRWL